MVVDPILKDLIYQEKKAAYMEQYNMLVDAKLPETQLYKMAGNSVTTNVVTAVANKLVLEILRLKGDK